MALLVIIAVTIFYRRPILRPAKTSRDSFSGRCPVRRRDVGLDWFRGQKCEGGGGGAQTEDHGFLSPGTYKLEAIISSFAVERPANWRIDRFNACSGTLTMFRV